MTNKDDITFSIADLRAIFGWSYPTALSFARRFGVRVEGGPGKGQGRWVVEYDVVASKVRYAQQNAADLSVRFGRVVGEALK